MIDELRMPETLKMGTPMAKKEHLICVYSESGAGKTTEIIKYLELSGKSSIYIDLDGNSAPIYNAKPEVIEKMNYLKLRNALDKIHVADFINGSMTTPLLKLCPEHGYLNCGICANEQRDMIAVMFDNWKDYDVVIVDSVTIMVNAVKLFSIKKSEEGKDNSPFDIWQRVSLMANTMMHFLRECHDTVIVLSHPVDVRHEYQKVIQKRPHQRAGLSLVDPYYRPCFGSVPFTREAAKNLSAVIYMNEDGSILTQGNKPYFANTRMEIKSTTVSGALQEILG